MSTFEPNIVGFLCNWCSYAGADLAGVSRIQYPTNMRVIKVMCSGRVEPGMVLELTRGGRGRRHGHRMPHRRLPLHHR